MRFIGLIFIDVLMMNSGGIKPRVKLMANNFCNKKINIFITLIYMTGKYYLKKWWAREDSNLRPMDYESTALTN